MPSGSGRSTEIGLFLFALCFFEAWVLSVNVRIHEVVAYELAELQDHRISPLLPFFFRIILTFPLAITPVALLIARPLLYQNLPLPGDSLEKLLPS